MNVIENELQASSTKDSICELLISSIDGRDLKRVSESLEIAGEKPEECLIILNEAINNTNSQIRKISAILSRRNLVHNYEKFDPITQRDVKDSLIKAINKEGNLSIIRSLAMCIGSIVQYYDIEEINGILMEISNMFAINHNSQRIVLLILYNVIIDARNEIIDQFIDTFITILLTSKIND